MTFGLGRLSMSKSKCAIAKILLTIYLFHIRLCNCDVAILNFKDDKSNQLDICALRKPYNNSDLEKSFNLSNYGSRYDGCSIITETFNQSAVLMRISSPTRCSFLTTVVNLQLQQAGVVIIGSDGPITINTSLVNFTIPFIFMPDEYAEKVTTFLSNSKYSSVTVSAVNNKFDASLIVIWFVALFCIVSGALWTRSQFIEQLALIGKEDAINNKSNLTSTNLAKKEKNNLSNSIENLVSINNNSANKQDFNQTMVTSINANNNNDSQQQQEKLFKKPDEDDSENKNLVTLSISYISILILLLFVVAILLLLYFFYNQMIYFVYVMFCIGSTSSFYRLGCLFFKHVNILGCKLPKINVPILRKYEIEPRKVILFLLSVAVSVVWFVFRHESWIWIIQNLMALCLSIHALSFYRLSKFKTVTLLLSVFFIYDIFMVFVTPQFTKGTSIMEAVAFGGKEASESLGPNDWSLIQFRLNDTVTTNRLPVVIIVPHLLPSKRLCNAYFSYPYSLLGLGDILIPGLSVNYAIIFDKCSPNTKIPVYFIVSVLAYLIGLLTAFIGLILMSTAQPALLYLCPMLIISTLITSLLRREFRVYWTGEPIKELTEQSKKINSKSSRIKNDERKKTSQPTDIEIVNYDEQIP